MTFVRTAFLLLPFVVLVGCSDSSGRTRRDVGPDLENRCISNADAERLGEEAAGFACSTGSWCDKVDGICKPGACGYDEDCPEELACDTDTNVCKPPCDLGDGVGCECLVDSDCPALSFCWGGHCLDGGTRDCSRSGNGELEHGDCRKDPTRTGDEVQVIRCAAQSLGIDCVDDRACIPFGGICNVEARRCEQLACARPGCARDGDCPAGQRCHPTASQCVEDLGCLHAVLWPSLACIEGQQCDLESNDCVEIEVGECTEENAAENCRDLEICDVAEGEVLGRCVQCITDIQCTAELDNEACQNSGDCAANASCVTDDEDNSTCRLDLGTRCNRARGICTGGGGCTRNVDCYRVPRDPVSCTTDIDCPAETFCEDLGTPEQSNKLCLEPTNRLCAAGSQECVIPLCETDEECYEDNAGDTRWSCDTTLWRCALPAPECGDDPNEPNNNTTNATLLSDFQEVPGPLFETGQQQLCRGDLDLYALAATDGQNIEATLALDRSGFVRMLEPATSCFDNQTCAERFDESAVCFGTQDGNYCHATVAPEGTFHVEILAPQSDEVLGQARLRDGAWDVTATATAMTEGTYHIRVRSNALGRDMFPYTLTVNQSTPPPCEIDEPNDTRGEAVGLPVGEQALQLRRFLCGADVDVYSFRVPANFDVEASIIATDDNNAAADLDLRLVGSNGQDLLAESVSPAGIEAIEWENEGDESRNVYLSVTRGQSENNQADPATYLLRLLVRPPFSCEGNIDDVPGDPEGAMEVHFDQEDLALIESVAMCAADDTDLFRVDLEPGERFTARLSHSPRHPVDLRILDPDGSQPVAYGVGPYGFKETGYLNATGAATSFYVWIGWSAQATAEERVIDVPYSLRLVKEAAAQCPDPEAEGEPNNQREVASSLLPGEQVLSRHLCGGADIDWYAMNIVEDTPVTIDVGFNHDHGDVDIYLFDAEREVVAVSASLDNDERIDLARTDGGIHYLRVDRFAAAQEVQTYSLGAQYSLGCTDDDQEEAGGDTSETALTVRAAGGVFQYRQDLVLCMDQDWWRLVVLAEELVVVQVTAPLGTGLVLHRLDANGVSSGEVATGQVVRNEGDNLVYELQYTGVEAFGFFAVQVTGPAARAPYTLDIQVTQ
jgi:hypothetical protein